jgi:hypothetical protein
MDYQVGQLYELKNSPGAIIHLVDVNVRFRSVSYSYVKDPYKRVMTSHVSEFVKDFNKYEPDNKITTLHNGLSVNYDALQEYNFDDESPAINVAKKEPDITCSCNSRDLFNFGCRCGAFANGDR